MSILLHCSGNLVFLDFYGLCFHVKFKIFFKFYKILTVILKEILLHL